MKHSSFLDEFGWQPFFFMGLALIVIGLVLAFGDRLASMP